MFKIGELSKKTNISVPTIRFYEQKGLLYPIKIDGWTGYRYYDESSINRLNEITYFKNFGFSLNEILNLNEQIIKNKIEESKLNIKKLTQNINVLSSFSKKGDFMNKQEIAKEVLQKLEQNHLNLYHGVDKKKVYNFIESQNWNAFDEKQFDYAMLKLFSMFDDAQTKWYIKYLSINEHFCFEEGNIYIKKDNKLSKVISFGNLSSNDLVKEFRQLLAYETNENFNSELRKALNNGYNYELLNLVKDNCFDIVVEFEDGVKTLQVKIIDKPINLAQRKKNYEYSLLENNILFIKYRKCKNDEIYTFNQFVQDLEKEVKRNKIKNYILDIRNNDGGNSGIINPLYDLLMEYNLNGIVLINNEVFGGACLNIAKLKKMFNVCLVGEATGGSTKRYGETKHLNVEDYVFTVSIKLFDISEIFGYKGSIQPDVIVPTTKEDIENKKDTHLEVAIKQFG